MKRDVDLARQILFEIEKQPSYLSEIHIDFEGYTTEQIHYHVMLLHEAGLIVAHNLSSSNDLYWLPERLTWQGHEFLEASRNNANWNKVKEIMAKGGGFVFDIAKAILIKLLEQQITSYTA